METLKEILEGFYKEGEPHRASTFDTLRKNIQEVFRDSVYKLNRDILIPGYDPGSTDESRDTNIDRRRRKVINEVRSDINTEVVVPPGVILDFTVVCDTRNNTLESLEEGNLRISIYYDIKSGGSGKLRESAHSFISVGEMEY